MAFQLQEFKKPQSCEAMGSKQFFSLKNNRDHLIFEVESGRQSLVKYLKSYAASQEEDLTFVHREEFKMLVKDLTVLFKFSELENYEEAVAGGKIGLSK